MSSAQIRHLYGTLNFSTQCTYRGGGGYSPQILVGIYDLCSGKVKMGGGGAPDRARA